MISLMPRLVLSTPASSAQSMPPTAAATSIAAISRGRGQPGKPSANNAAKQRADEELSLATDIPDPGTKRHGQTQRDDQERRGLQQRLLDLTLTTEGALEHDSIGCDWIGAGQKDEERTDQ